MNASTADIKALYDLTAKEYADFFSNEHEHKPMDREVLRQFAEEVGKRGPVWDLGCGPGHTTRHLVKLGVNVSGMDLSGRILEEARQRHPGICFQQGDMLDLDFRDRSLAGIIAFYSIVHFTEAQVRRAFSEIHRILRPGGLLLCAFHVGEGVLHVDEFLGKKVDTSVTFFKTAWIEKELGDAGFKRMETREREPYPDIEYQSRRAYVFARK